MLYKTLKMEPQKKIALVAHDHKKALRRMPDYDNYHQQRLPISLLAG